MATPAIWLLGWDSGGYDLEVDPTSTKVESTFGKCVFLSAIQQTVILMLAGYVLDQGETARSVLCACGAYWAGIAFVVLRRREHSYSSSDKFFARWAFLAVLIGVVAVSGLYQAMHRH